jgi:hypothetical protein
VHSRSALHLKVTIRTQNDYHQMDHVRKMTKIDYEQTIPAFVLKVLAFVVPAYIISRVWIAHPHIAFGLGLAVGSILQHFIPPRGKLRELCILLFFAVLGALLDSALGSWWH